MSKTKLSRRDFLKIGTAASAGLALSACGVDVTKVAVATPTTSPIPAPVNTGTPTASPTARPPTIAELSRKIGMDVGIEANYLGLFSPNKTAVSFADAPQEYVNALLNFSLLTNGYEGDPQWTDYKPDIAFAFWHDFSLFCKEHDIHLSLDHMFYGLGHFDENSPIADLVEAPKEVVLDWMKNRVKRFFEIPYFTQLNFVNEALYGNDETGEYGWVTDLNPFYRIWGKDYVRQCYLMVFEEAMRTGRTVGKDLRLIYNVPNIEYDTPLASYEYDHLSRLKTQLQAETGLERPFDIGMEFHTRTLPLKEVTCWGPAADKLEKASLIQHFQKFGEIGDIHVSELTIATPDKERELEIFHTVIESAIESGVCKGLIMWGPFAPADVPWADCTMRHLFEGDFHSPKPSYIFDELYKILQKYAI